VGKRFDPWDELIRGGHMRRGTYTGYVEGVRDWEELARIHCAQRNACVVQVLLHLQSLRRIGLVLDPVSVECHAAIRQMRLPERQALPVPEWVEDIFRRPDLDEPQRKRLRQKFFTTQDAHCLPCQVLINGLPIQDYLRPNPPAMDMLEEYAHLNAQFAVVQRMPALFNETDSHAERSGLAEALAAACRALVLVQRAPEPVRHASLMQAYCAYVSAGQAAMNEAVRQNQAAMQGTRDEAERIYRAGKINLLDLYCGFIQSELPDHLVHPGLIQVFEQSWAA
jgi:hypothetical protein